MVVIEQELGTGEICQQVLVSSCWRQRSAMIVSVSSYDLGAKPTTGA